MAIFVPFFKRFWVKCTLIGLLVLAVLVGSMFAVFYRLSDFDRLQQLSQDIMQGSSRKITFDTQIERHLFPRPTVVLQKVMLSEPDGRTPAANIEKVHIGVAWTSIFGNWTVEKLMLDKPATVLIRHDNGKWNYADLWESPQQKVMLNRVVIRDGGALVQAFGRQVQLKEISYHQMRQNQHTMPYVFQANAENPLWRQLSLSATGNAVHENNTFSLPDMVLQFSGNENGGDFSGSLMGHVSFLNGKFTSKNNKLVFRSDRWRSHVDTTIEQMVGENEHLALNRINSVFTGSLRNDERINGTLSSHQAKLDPNQLSSNEASMNFSVKTNDNNSLNINMVTPISWHNQTGLQLPHFQVSTRQDQPNGMPRFVSEFSGSLNVKNNKHWHTQIQGQLDRQPVGLNVARENNTVNGVFRLGKFDFANYLDKLENSSDNPYPSWLKDELAVNMDIEIGTLSLPALEANNIKTILRANAKESRFEPFSANLYAGFTEGSFSILNNQPVQYVLRQNAKDVQVRPLMQDLFRNATISGKGNVELNFITTGANRQELTENLSGSLNLNVENGNWYGINIRELMRAAAASSEDNATNLNLSKSTSDNGTPFDRFVFTSKIEQGVSHHSTDSHFTSPLVSMVAKGETNLYSGRMSEDVNLLSNNNQNALPLRITGTLDNPAISLNYQKITSGLKTPQQKKDAVTDALKKQWDWMREQNKDKK